MAVNNLPVLAVKFPWTTIKFLNFLNIATTTKIYLKNQVSDFLKLAKVKLDVIYSVAQWWS